MKYIKTFLHFFLFNKEIIFFKVKAISIKSELQIEKKMYKELVSQQIKYRYFLQLFPIF